MTAQHRTIARWTEFQEAWSGMHNFLMTGECVPFEFTFPPVDRIVEEMRQSKATDVRSGAKANKLLLDDKQDELRTIPLDQMMKQPFAMGNFRLGEFDAPGKFLHGFGKRVLDPWRAALADHGFTFERCYPIIFLGGPGYATNYHMDFSHVLAWQVYGIKRFCGLRNPDRWAPREMRVLYRAGVYEKPPEITEADALCYEMKPGDVLWNTILTPHWVEASDSVAMSINISHGGVRLHGKLCPVEQELEDFRAKHPEIAPKKIQGKY